MLVIFTDLDGTLLDPVDYSFEGALPALEAVRQRGSPLVFCTSKTRAEVEHWRRLLDNDHPFIVENGGALLVPQGYFPAGFRAPKERDGFCLFEFGGPYRRRRRTRTGSRTAQPRSSAVRIRKHLPPAMSSSCTEAAA